MSVKSDYYKMSEKQFSHYLSNIKKSNDTICFFSNTSQPYYLNINADLVIKLYQLDKARMEFDYLINSFSTFGKNQILQSFMIDEIQSSNKIENIYSTKHEIFYLINNNRKTTNNKIKSIVNTYKLLLGNSITINNVSDIRKTYDLLLADSLEKDAKLDGNLFRKSEVFITDGQKTVHSGFYPESKIIDGLNEFLNFYNSDKDVFLKAIVSHLLFETIHPFYDGNGRMGRFLMSLIVYNETKSLFSFLISSSFSKVKSKYYNAFKVANDVHSFNIINDYVEEMLALLSSNLNSTKKLVEEYKEKINSYKYDLSLSKKEKIIYSLLVESSVLSNFGLCNEEIEKLTSISKRTIVKTINKLKDSGLITDTKIGKYNYHKLLNID